jgi:hypothetical protein
MELVSVSLYRFLRLGCDLLYQNPSYAVKIQPQIRENSILLDDTASLELIKDGQILQRRYRYHNLLQ